MTSTPPPDSGVPKSKNILSAVSIFHKGTLAIALVTLTLTIVLVWFGLVVKLKVLEVEKQWFAYSKEASYSAHVLGRIQEEFGYGGFIHNFKNYVLRKDKTLIPKIESSLEKTRHAINEYPLDGLFQDLDDKVYINELTQVVGLYSVNFDLARRLIEKGVSSNEIDRQVKVNDEPALQAIKHLSKHVVEHNEEYTLETRKHLKIALNFINWGLLIIPLVMISGAFMFVLLRTIKKINYSLEESRLFLSDLFEAAPDAMIIVDENGYITDANQQADSLLNSSDKSLIGKSVESFMPQRFRKRHIKNREDSFNKTEKRMLSSDLNLYVLGKDDEEIPVEISLSYTVRNDNKNAIVTLRDITEKKRIEENIKYLAQYDQLTKLPNRALFNDRLSHAIERAYRNKSKIGLMFIDLDGFKNINDSFGHQAGDELLQIIAERISNIMRTEDTIARLGGDEFTIILEELKHSDYATVVAKKVLQAVGDVIYLSGHEVTVGASIGISIYPDNGNNANDLIKNADISMYQAKSQGKNCFKFFIENEQ